MYTSAQEYNPSLLQFLNNSPTAFHAVDEIKNQLQASGFIELPENIRWNVKKGNGYFVQREGALIAFILGSEENIEDGFRMVGSHSDSPGLQLKPQAGYSSPPYLQLGVEVYGGPLLTTWFDRDLSLAGRVTLLNTNDELEDYLIDFRRALLSIPSLAIHFDREANTSKSVDKQKNLPPLLAQVFDEQLPEFASFLIDHLGKQNPGLGVKKLLGFDLFCYDVQPATHTGINQEFLVSGRLDNLLSCHVATTAITESNKQYNALFLCTNHEENGSTSSTGANGSFIDSIMTRLAPEPEERQICLRNSFFISVDNAHAVHPNARDKSDAAHDIVLNGGPVIKINANQRYATNSRTTALFKLLCHETGVNFQEFVMRSDLPCGSTIGPMTAARLGVETLDVGAPTLAMHSIRELTGSTDPYSMLQVIHQFMESESILRRG